jgi:hypothetical protein
MDDLHPGEASHSKCLLDNRISRRYSCLA